MKKLIASTMLATALTASAYTTTNTVGSFRFGWDWPYPTINLAGFNIYWGTNSFYDGGGNAFLTLPVGSQTAGANANATNYTVLNLPVGVKFYFVVTASCTDGRESPPSAQLTNTVTQNFFQSPVNVRPLP